MRPVLLKVKPPADIGIIWIQ